MTSDIPAVATVTEYLVSCLPLDDINASGFTITVAWRGGDLWAVVRHTACLNKDGYWDYEPIPSERTDEWIAEHRFELATALRLAKEAAPHIRCNRWTVADALDARAREAAVTS